MALRKTGMGEALNWQPIATAPFGREVLLAGKSGYCNPHEVFVVNGYRIVDWHQAEWNDVTGTRLSDRGWWPDVWAEMPISGKDLP